MGYYKELEIERMQDPLFDVPDINVGISCFGNQLIISYIKRNGKVDICHYTGRKELTISLKVILRYILDIINEYFTDPVNEAGWDRHLNDEGSVPGFILLGDGYVIPEYKAHYEYTEDLLECEGLEVSSDVLYKDIIEYLPENFWVERDLYGLNDSEIKSIDWQEIVRKSPQWVDANLTYDMLPVADRARLFQLLQDFHFLDSFTIKEKPLTLYRTVRYHKLLESVSFSDITSAPSKYARANRMSKEHESMFYGASTSECSQIESIGDESAVYYVGKFESIRPLALLDFRSIRQRLSIFDIDYSLYYSVCFLKSFAKQISRPIADGDKQSEYAPTQFITDFFRKAFFLHKADGKRIPIDGILYDSSKVSDAYNAVLFYDNAMSAKHLRLVSHSVIDTRKNDAD